MASPCECAEQVNFQPVGEKPKCGDNSPPSQDRKSNRDDKRLSTSRLWTSQVRVSSVVTHAGGLPI
jgi:hypothetical protein